MPCENYGFGTEYHDGRDLRDEEIPGVDDEFRHVDDREHRRMVRDRERRIAEAQRGKDE